MGRSGSAVLEDEAPSEPSKRDGKRVTVDGGGGSVSAHEPSLGRSADSGGGGIESFSREMLSCSGSGFGRDSRDRIGSSFGASSGCESYARSMNEHIVYSQELPRIFGQM